MTTADEFGAPAAVASTPPAEAVLRAVSECTADMASVRDRVVVLKAILRRTRRLLGTDMSYMSLNDLTAGETYIHLTDGVQTEAYRTIRMPLGTGVLGAVAAGGAAVQTTDYLHDPEMNHLSEIDVIVQAEGVKTIMGAPLRIGGRMVGALLVASRSRTVFPDEAVHVLEQMAAQTAIALEQWRLKQEILRLGDEVRATETNVELRLRELEDIVRLDERLMGSLLTATSAAGVLDPLSEAIGAPVALHDPNGALLSGGPPLPAEAFSAWEVRSAIGAAAQSGHAVGIRFGAASFMVAAASAGDEHLATLAVRGPVRAEHAVMLERASVFVSAILLFERSLIDADNRAKSVLFDDLVTARFGDRRAVEQNAERYGLSVHGANSVLVIPTAPVQRYQVMSAVREALAPAPAIVSLHGAHVCVIVGSKESGEIAKRVVTALSARKHVPLVGMATGTRGIDGIAPAHEQAHQVAAAQIALGWKAGYADAVQLGLAGMMLSGTSPAVVDELIERMLGPLIDYDARHNTQLLLTAWTYFECGTRLESTAAHLFVHKNTVRQRAERIDAILGAGWRTAPRSVDIHFALRVWRLREAEESSTDML